MKYEVIIDIHMIMAIVQSSLTHSNYELISCTQANSADSLGAGPAGG